MSVINTKTISQLVLKLTLIGCIFSVDAQDVSIPDPGLNAAIRETLQKPTGPLTVSDLLSLTVLDASRRDVSNITGLETARNLVSLDLQINHLTEFALPVELANLASLDLSDNPLTNFFIPGGMTNLVNLFIEAAGLTNLSLPEDLIRLKTLDLANNQFSRFDLAHLNSLAVLDLSFNQFVQFTLPDGLTNLERLTLRGNLLTDFALPTDLTRLTELDLSENQLTSLSPPAGMTNLLSLDLFFNQLTNLTLPSDAQNLTELNLDFNQLSSLDLLTNLTSLRDLHLRANRFTNFTLPAALTSLTLLDVSTNPLSRITLPAGLNQLATLRLSNDKLTSLVLPSGLTHLAFLNLSQNQLTNLTLPSDLFQLESLELGGNQLASITLPGGLTNLTGLFLTANELTHLTLPPDMTRLVNLGFLDNPLTTLVLSEPLTASTNLVVNLNDTVATLPNKGVLVFTYPLAVQLLRPRPLTGAFQFGITGPPGVYAILGTSDLRVWSEVGIVSNELGSVSFVDSTSHLFPLKFYRAQPQPPPSNMVFIPPNTFTMGSPTNELHRQPNEGPQTTVTLTRGFWIGTFEVTQGEYVDVTGTNPSFFPGDLSRPVSSVSWPDATNYCWLLTQRELAAGRISPGSEYRLPTEAEWECAARAGTTTRFSYGDDPDYTSLTNNAWYFLNAGLTVHPVGQKRPNPWGLYDMEGNVWEWTQDWLGDLPGGTVSDPTGPPSNPIGLKVVRGGSYDFAEPDCRSARRFSFGNHPALNDTDIGFRVVLEMRP